MDQDIPMLTLQEKTSLEGVITLVKAIVLCLKYEKITEDLAPTDLLLISSKDQPSGKWFFVVAKTCTLMQWVNVRVYFLQKMLRFIFNGIKTAPSHLRSPVQSAETENT